jgi:hypothetical protein
MALQTNALKTQVLASPRIYVEQPSCTDCPLAKPMVPGRPLPFGFGWRLARSRYYDDARQAVTGGNRVEVAQTMGWVRGYYYRVRKVKGRVIREYIGAGEVAKLVARMDALERERRRLELLERRRAKEELKALDADQDSLSESTELAARAALLAAGYHLRNRGEWRKRREQDGIPTPGQPTQA